MRVVYICELYVELVSALWYILLKFALTILSQNSREMEVLEDFLKEKGKTKGGMMVSNSLLLKKWRYEFLKPLISIFYFRN